MNKKVIKYSLITLLLSVLFVFLFTIYSTECNGVINCFRYMTLGTPQQYYAVPLIGIAISLLPYLFLNKIDVWRWCALLIISVPIIFLSIKSIPARGLNELSIPSSREEAVYLYTSIFILISWLIALWGFVKGK